MHEQECDIIREFNIRMAEGEHTEDFRYQITKSALKKYKDLRRMEDEGTRRLYRNKEDIMKTRKDNKFKKSKAGWLKNKCDRI